MKRREGVWRIEHFWLISLVTFWSNAVKLNQLSPATYQRQLVFLVYGRDFSTFGNMELLDSPLQLE